MLTCPVMAAEDEPVRVVRVVRSELDTVAGSHREAHRPGTATRFPGREQRPCATPSPQAPTGGKPSGACGIKTYIYIYIRIGPTQSARCHIHRLHMMDNGRRCSLALAGGKTQLEGMCHD